MKHTLYPFTATLVASYTIGSADIGLITPQLVDKFPGGTVTVPLGGFFYGDGALVDYFERLTGAVLEPGGAIAFDDEQRLTLAHDVANAAAETGHVASALFPHGDRPCNGVCVKAIESLAQAMSKDVALAGIPHTVQLHTLALPKE